MSLYWFSPYDKRNVDPLFGVVRSCSLSPFSWRMDDFISPLIRLEFSLGQTVLKLVTSAMTRRLKICITRLNLSCL